MRLRFRRRPRKPHIVWKCTTRGCEAPAEPWDGPFCPDHNWENC